MARPRLYAEPMVHCTLRIHRKALAGARAEAKRRSCSVADIVRLWLIEAAGVALPAPKPKEPAQ